MVPAHALAGTLAIGWLPQDRNPGRGRIVEELAIGGSHASPEPSFLDGSELPALAP